MRKAFLMGALILFAGSVGVAVAQERLPQASGFGTGVGDSAGTGTRSQIWDKAALLERLSQPETLYGRVLAVDIPGHRIHLETGGSSHDEGRAGSGAMSSLTVYIDADSNMDQLKTVQSGDDVIVQAREEVTDRQPYGTGRKLVRDVTVLRVNEKMRGFGGLGQRPDPNSERGILSNDSSSHAGVVGQVMPGEIKSGIHSDIGEMTGAAPCWQCEPQPGWGFASPTNKSDWGGSENPNYTKQ